ncbi:MAG: class I tRNA ligase family protein, partial [Bacilli bacterium]|nr:class I tRNA ligase family protein [Bacilli bacterium]
DFASWYLEMTKVALSIGTSEEKKNTCAVLNYVLTVCLKLLHPFMPFVTEDIYQAYNDGSITISKWPTYKKEYNFENASKFNIIFDIITSTRNIRNQKNVPLSKKIDLVLQFKDNEYLKFVKENEHYLQKFVNFNDILYTIDDYDTNKCLVNVLNNVIVIIPLSALVNMEEEKQKLLQEEEKMINEIKRCEGMLNNPNFINKAPTQKIDQEKQKLDTYKARLNEIKKLLLDL